MPLTTYTGTTEMTEVVPTEELSSFIAAYEWEPRSADSIVAVRGGRGNVPIRFARWNQMTGVPAGTVAETVDGVDANIDITESSITPGMVRFRFPISDEVIAAAEGGVPAGALAETMDAMADRIETDILANSTSATSTSGSATVAFQLSQFRTALQTYRALRCPGDMHALVLHDDALGSLETAIDNSSSPHALKREDTLARELGQAYQGRLRGFQVFLSGRVADESSGHSNFATPMGANSGLGIVVNKLPHVVATRGDEAENRKVTFYHFAAWYGTGLINPRRFLEVLSA